MRELTLKIRNQEPGEVCACREVQYDEHKFGAELQRFFDSLPEAVKPGVCLITCEARFKIYEAIPIIRELDVVITNTKEGKPDIKVTEAK